jgi:hypothetical protein
MKKIRYTSVFDEEILRYTPLYYRFMNKLSKEDLAKIEQTFLRQSNSLRHRSSSYFLYEPCKPFTRFIPNKIML